MLSICHQIQMEWFFLSEVQWIPIGKFKFLLEFQLEFGPIAIGIPIGFFCKGKYKSENI
jgi:hypothetical protein